MADPKSRNIIGKGIHKNRDKWYIQGHIGSTWKDGQYYRTRDMAYVRPAFEDLLARLQTDCHACESRCPFGVKIAERMKKTAELFGC